MKRGLAAIALGFSIAGCVAFSQSASEDCSYTRELTVLGDVMRDEQGDLELHGYVTNASTYLEYEDVLVKVELYDEKQNRVGTQTITVKEDVEKGETEDFREPVTVVGDICCAKFTIVCAERDYGGIAMP